MTTGATEIEAPNEQLQKWRRWLKAIKDDVHRAYYHRDLYLGTMEIVDANPRVDGRSFFFGFFRNIFVDSLVMAVRRQVRDDRRSGGISLAGLLRELEESPDQVKRSDFRALYSGDRFEFGGIDIADGDFSTFAAPGEPHIDPARVTSDLESLDRLSREVEEYATRRIAHWDKRPPSNPVTGEMIFAALDEVGRLVKKYALLLEAAVGLELSPVPQGPVYHVFQVPWFSLDGKDGPFRPKR